MITEVEEEDTHTLRKIEKIRKEPAGGEFFWNSCRRDGTQRRGSAVTSALVFLRSVFPHFPPIGSHF